MSETAPVMAAATTHDDDPFRYGWRYVRRIQPDGSETYDQVPLTLNDLLHPEEGDQMTHSRIHGRTVRYLCNTLEAWFASDPTAVVLDDVRIAWDIAELRAHGPDVMVILGVREHKNWSTFDVGEEGVRPLLIIEVTSPDTRANDLTHKVDHYELAGVPYYIVVDLRQRDELTRPRLLGNRLINREYRQLVPDEQGRLLIEPLGLRIGVEDNTIYLYDLEDRRLGDYTEVVHALATATTQAAEAETRAAEAETRAAEAETRAAEAEARVAAEARARQEAEERLQALRAELRRLRGE